MVVKNYKGLKMSRSITAKTQSSEIDKTETKISEKEAIASLLALIESLSYEVCSGDMWFLAMMSAKNIAVKKYGVDEMVFLEMMARVEKSRKAKNKQNPMSSMF